MVSVPIELDSTLVERLAPVIHEAFLRDQEAEPPERQRPRTDPSLQPWERLPERLRRQNRSQARHIPAKLRAIGCGVLRRPDPNPEAVRLTSEEVERLAALEHERWADELRQQGGTLGPKDPERPLQSPFLVPFEDLPPHIQEYDREPVRRMPHYLAALGLEMVRLETADP